MKDSIPVKRYKIFQAIHEERIRQDEKWGEQNHDMLNVPFFTQEDMVRLMTAFKEMNASGEYCSWFNILMEEVFEAFAETDPVKQREEMIQAAAVAVQIIEYLNRKIDEKGETTK